MPLRSHFVLSRTGSLRVETGETGSKLGTGPEPALDLPCLVEGEHGNLFYHFALDHETELVSVTASPCQCRRMFDLF